jgi:Ca-activated chloride channel homolog
MNKRSSIACLRRLVVIPVFFYSFVGVAATVYCQDEIVRVDSTLINVPVTVLDHNGRYLTGLKKSDFEIRENGIIQEIAFFEPVEVPVTVLLLLDTSGSMNENLGALAGASNALIAQLKAEDQLIVATFADDSNIHIIRPPTKKKEFRQGITLLPRYNDTYTTTFNAVDKAIKYVTGFSGRRAIVLFSDGELFGRGVSAKDNLHDAEEQEALIYTVRFGEYPNSQPGYERVLSSESIVRYGKPKKEIEALVARVNEYMHGLSGRTGGRSYDVTKIEDLGAAFRAIGTDLGQQYRLGYYPRHAGLENERRKIAVRVDIPQAAVRSRNEVVYKK